MKYDAQDMKPRDPRLPTKDIRRYLIYLIKAAK